MTSVELLMPTEASSRLLTTSVSMAFKPIPFSDDYQPKGNFILEQLWKHLLEEVRADDSLFVPNSIQRYTIYIQSILLSLTLAYSSLPNKRGTTAIFLTKNWYGERTY